MKNTFGNNVAITLFGESHGDMIGAVLDGIAAGVKIDVNEINKEMSLDSIDSRLGRKTIEITNLSL